MKKCNIKIKKKYVRFEKNYVIRNFVRNIVVVGGFWGFFLSEFIYIIQLTSKKE